MQSDEETKVNQMIVLNESDETEKESDGDYDGNSQINKLEPCSSRTPVKLKIDLSSLAMAYDRHGISDRSTSSLAIAALEDFGLLLPEIEVNVIGKNKVRRARKRKRSILQKPNKSDNAILFLFF